MAFQVRNSLNPTDSANNWSTGVAGAGAKLLKGYSAPRRDPQANPGRSASNWQAGVASAAPRYQAGIAGYDAQAAIASMQANGVSRYTQAAQTKKAKVVAFHQNYDSVIAAGMNALPADRSSYAARKARSDAMQDYLHNHPYKGGSPRP